MSTLKNNLRQISGMFPSPLPRQKGERTPRYYVDKIIDAIQTKGEFSHNIIYAKANNLDKKDPNKLKTIRIRVADIVRAGTGVQKSDNWLEMMLIDEQYDWLPIMTKFYFMDSIWFLDSPFNITAVINSGTLRRADGMLNFLDFYGNIVSEPFYQDLPRTQRNRTDMDSVMFSAESFSNFFMAYNDVTRKYIQNDIRIILGSGRDNDGQAYVTRGLNNWTREFTLNRTSVGELTFSTMKAQEGKTDDLILCVADRFALNNKWTLRPSVERLSGTIGDKGIIITQAFKNEILIEDTPKYPISISYESSDSDIVYVNMFTGEYELLNQGTAIIICRLDQRKDISADYPFIGEDLSEIQRTIQENKGVWFDIQVEIMAALVDNFNIQFQPLPLKTIKEMQPFTISAFLFNNATQLSGKINWTFENVPTNKFNITYVDDNKIIISSVGGGYANAPLKVIAEINGYKNEFNVVLAGMF